MGLNNKSEGKGIYASWTCYNCGKENASLINRGNKHMYVVNTSESMYECKHCGEMQVLDRTCYYAPCDN